jgi:hypothetical protein
MDPRIRKDDNSKKQIQNKRKTQRQLNVSGFEKTNRLHDHDLQVSKSISESPKRFR